MQYSTVRRIPVDIREVDHRVDPLGVQVERESGDVDVARPFAVAEDAALHPLRPGQHRTIADQVAHESIVDAIRARDPELATIRARSHLSGIRDTVR